MKLYARNGFVVNIVMMDMEFENGSDMIVNTLLNTTDTREHVGEIERGIRIVKYWNDT